MKAVTNGSAVGQNYRHVLLAAIITIWGCGSAYARLGETSAQCAQRYGAPLSSRQMSGNDSYYAWTEVQYRSEGLDVTVCYVNDKAVKLIVAGPYQKFNEGKAGAVLNKNAEGEKWTVPFVVRSVLNVDIRKEGPFEWSRSDGGWAKHTVLRTMEGEVWSQLDIFSAASMKSGQLREQLELYRARAQSQSEKGDVSNF